MVEVNYLLQDDRPLTYYYQIYLLALKGIGPTILSLQPSALCKKCDER